MQRLSDATWVAIVADIHQRKHTHMDFDDVEALARSVLKAIRKGKSGLGNVPGGALGALIEESFRALSAVGYMSRLPRPEKKYR